MQEWFLNQLDKLKGWWNKFNKRQKISVIALIAGIVIALVVTIIVVMQPKFTKIATYKTLSEQQQVVAALESYDTPYIFKTEPDLSVWVEESQAGNAVFELETNKVTETPKYDFFDAFAGSQMGTTENTQTQQFNQARQTQLESLFNLIESVSDSRVILDIPKAKGILLDSKTAPTASIILTAKPNTKITKEVAETIASLTKTAVTDLTDENITISDQNGTVLFVGGRATTDSTSLSTTQEAQEYINATYAARVEKLIRNMYDRVEVTPNIKLNWVKITEEIETFSNPTGDNTSNKGYVAEEEITKESYENGSSDNQPGLDANDQDIATNQMGVEDSASGSLNQSHSQYFYNNATRFVDNPTGEVLTEESSFAVSAQKFVPYYEESYDSAANNNMTWTQFKDSIRLQDIEYFNIDDREKQLIGSATGIDISNITMIGYKVPVFYDMERVQTDIYQIVMLAVLAILIILIAFGLIKKTQPEVISEIEPELSVENLLVSTQIEEQREAEAEKMRDIELGKESEVKKQIDKFIQGKPESAAQLLRNWLNDDWE